MRQLGVRHLTATAAHVVTVAPALRRFGAPEEVFTEWTCSAVHAPGASVWARTPQGVPCAIRRRVGRGEAALVGFGMTHRFDYHVSMASAILQALGVHPHVAVEPWDVPVMVRADGRGTALVTICNPHEEAKSVVVRVRVPNRDLQLPDRGRMTIAARSVCLLPVGLDLGGGVRVAMTTCELRVLSRAPSLSLGAVLDAAGKGVLLLETPARMDVQVQGARAVFQRQGRRLRVELSGARLTSCQISFKNNR